MSIKRKGHALLLHRTANLCALPRCCGTAIVTVRVVLALAPGVLGSGCRSDAEPQWTERGLSNREVKLVTSKREGQIRLFPCSQCHDKIDAGAPGAAGTLNRRSHREIVFTHYKNVQDCLLCHQRQDRNYLRLLSGKGIGFDESHALCGQCHSERLRDWRMGAHGKLVGGWQGIKHRYTCTDCHDPHQPAPAPTNALPPPPFPKLGIRKGEHP